MFTQLSAAQETKLTRLVGSGFILILCLLLVQVLIARHTARQAIVLQADEQQLEQKIKKLHEKTVAIQQAAQLYPVWKNWSQAKDVAADYGLKLTPRKDDRRRRAHVWVGEITGDSLLTLAVAREIQKNVAAEILQIHQSGSRFKITLAVLGMED